jgi:ElaB/YqjD/DUF883 family membrane-anchored ribosome-binding protein
MRYLCIIILMFTGSSFGLDKAEIDRTLQMMQEQGTFSPEQIAEARKKLNALSDEDLNKMVNKAQKAAEDPKMREKAQKLLNNYKNSSPK